MNITRKDVYLELKLHPQELNLLTAVLNAMYKLMTQTQLDSAYYNQEKESRCKELEKMLSVLSIEEGPKTAESLDDTIVRFVLEKACVTFI